MPRRSSGPSSTRATSLSSTGVPPFALDDDLLEVGDALEIAAAAHHVLGLGKFDRAAADIHVAGADRVADLWQRDAERPQAAADR